MSQPLKSVTVLQNMSVVTKWDQTLLTFFFMHKFVSKIQKTFSISFVFLSTLYEKKSKTSVHWCAILIPDVLSHALMSAGGGLNWVFVKFS